MNFLKRAGTLALAFTMAVCLAACGGGNPGAGDAEPAENTDAAPIEETGGEEQASPVKEDLIVRVAAMKGPTAMGLAELMRTEENREDTSGTTYAFTLAASPDMVTPELIQGSLDIACVPANLASVLWNRTQGGLVCLAINTLGVLYIVEREGENVQSIADLTGKTVVASGKGSTPEYALRYLLEQNGLNPDTDVTIDWKSEHSECVAAMASGAADLAMLPQPFAAVAQSLDSVRLQTALDLTAQWDALDNGSAMITGVAVARREFVEEHPAAVSEFLNQYAQSVEWVNANTADAAELIGAFDIVDAAVAERALPYCNIVCITGAELREKLSGYLEVLYNAAPESVGGSLPGDDFYYGA